MPRVQCPHCLEQLELPESAGLTCCPLCAGSLDLADPEEAASAEYGLLDAHDNPHKSEDVKQYVQGLEKRARQKRREQPYHRKRFPVDLAAGWLLLLIGLVLIVTAVFSDRGLMDIFVNALMPALILFMLSALCFIFWHKTRP
jgi:hypothetical protein